jgi:hypothetical protein
MLEGEAWELEEDVDVVIHNFSFQAGNGWKKCLSTRVG